MDAAGGHRRWRGRQQVQGSRPRARGSCHASSRRRPRRARGTPVYCHAEAPTAGRRQTCGCLAARPPTHLNRLPTLSLPCARLGQRQVRDTPSWLSRLQATATFLFSLVGERPWLPRLHRSRRPSNTSKLFTMFGNNRS